MDTYIPGNFYKKYYNNEVSDYDWIIVTEHPEISRILKQYIKNTKKDMVKNKTNQLIYTEEMDPANITEMNKNLELIERELKKDPNQFLRTLKKTGQKKHFMRYVLEFDKQNAFYKLKADEYSFLKKRESQIMAYVLAVGIICGVLLHQLYIFF